MSDNKGLSDQELLKLCQSGGPVTNEDIGGKTQSGSNGSSDITYLNESGMQGTSFWQFSRNESKDKKDK